MMWMIVWWGCATEELDTGFELELNESVSEEDSGEIDDSGNVEDTETEEPLNDRLELVGQWEDVFGDQHHVTETIWLNPTGIFRYSLIFRVCSVVFRFFGGIIVGRF